MHQISKTFNKLRDMEEINEFIESMHKTEQELADRITQMYLEQFPRKMRYPIDLSCSEDDSEVTYYYEFSDDELAILRQWQDMSKVDRSDYDWLGGFLEEKGRTDIVERLTEDHFPIPFDLINDCDLDNPLSFMRCSVRKLQEDGQLSRPENRGVALSDEEYKQFLAHMLIDHNFTVNSLVYVFPELGKKIMYSCEDSIAGAHYPSLRPFIVELDELKAVMSDILDPFKDVIHLFDSKDEALRDFALRKQITPNTAEIFEKTSDEAEFKVYACFLGREIVVNQFRHFYDSIDTDQDDEIRIDAKKAMEHFGLNDINEIIPYLVKNYAQQDAVEKLRKEWNL